MGGIRARARGVTVRARIERTPVQRGPLDSVAKRVSHLEGFRGLAGDGRAGSPDERASRWWPPLDLFSATDGRVLPLGIDPLASFDLDDDARRGAIMASGAMACLACPARGDAVEPPDDGEWLGRALGDPALPQWPARRAREAWALAPDLATACAIVASKGVEVIEWLSCGRPRAWGATLDASHASAISGDRALARVVMTPSGPCLLDFASSSEGLCSARDLARELALVALWLENETPRPGRRARRPLASVVVANPLTGLVSWRKREDLSHDAQLLGVVARGIGLDGRDADRIMGAVGPGEG